MGSGKDWKALAQAVVERRSDLHLTQRGLAARMNMSERILGSIEKAERDSYARATYRALERGLRWAEGSVAAVLEGGSPTPLPQHTRATPPVGQGPLAAKGTAVLVAEINERLTELARRVPDERRTRAGASTLPDLDSPDSVALGYADMPDVDLGTDDQAADESRREG